MEYRRQIDIDRPRTEVVDLFLDPENLKAWQPSLVSMELLSGPDPSALGAVTRQLHRMGKREVEMVQTITQHDPPEAFAATYEADKVWNLVENRFTEIDGGRTRWVVDNTFRCAGMMRLMSALFPGMFRKQTLSFMESFKAFAERAG